MEDGRGEEKGQRDRKREKGGKRDRETGSDYHLSSKAHRIKTGFTSLMCRGGGTSEEVKSGGR